LTIFNGSALTPFFVTPMLDFGYDTADCCAVDPVVRGRLTNLMVYKHIASGREMEPNAAPRSHRSDMTT